MSKTLSSPFTLTNGSILRNRIAKSAMSENMASKGHLGNDKFTTLYKRWNHGGAGLLITGNIMIDSQALGEPNNIVIEEGIDLTPLKSWATCATEKQTHCWVQLNHPGKQSPKFLSKRPVAPSAIPLGGALAASFNPPRELEESEIQNIISRFAFAASKVKELGFTGVQIHGAHGYLISQFLSPYHNRRKDQWGGSLENRMRFVVEIYKKMRKLVGPSFPIGIKLNSADFQKGGFTEEESMEVVSILSQLGIDLIEISGGNYESQVMMGNKRTSTKVREAYFLEYCKKVRTLVDTPLMLTGGFRSQNAMQEALDSGACDIIGLGRSIVLNPDFPNQLMNGENIVSEVHPLTTGWKMLDKLFPLEITWYTNQIHRMGNGKNPRPNLSVKVSVLQTLISIGIGSLKRVRA